MGGCDENSLNLFRKRKCFSNAINCAIEVDVLKRKFRIKINAPELKLELQRELLIGGNELLI
jgi:hypothetical protein